MKLAVPVLHPQRGYTLLTEGFELDMPLIRKLIELDIHEFWIEYPGTQQIKQYVSPAVFQQQSQMISVVADMFDAVHQDAYAKIDFPHYRRTLQSFIESLVNDPRAPPTSSRSAAVGSTTSGTAARCVSSASCWA